MKQNPLKEETSRKGTLLQGRPENKNEDHDFQKEERDAVLLLLLQLHSLSRSTGLRDDEVGTQMTL
jgi:hypothetical protein